ncbi:MAG: hypothetical protein RLZZ562_849, partial [Planctomycetota bacterium]
MEGNGDTGSSETMRARIGHQFVDDINAFHTTRIVTSG